MRAQAIQKPTALLSVFGFWDINILFRYNGHGRHSCVVPRKKGSFLDAAHAECTDTSQRQCKKCTLRTPRSLLPETGTCRTPVEHSVYVATERERKQTMRPVTSLQSLKFVWPWSEGSINARFGVWRSNDYKSKYLFSLESMVLDRDLIVLGA